MISCQKKAYPKDRTKSDIEVFVIESLSMAEERREAFEGRALCDSLRTLGWKPCYHYVRTAQELQTALELFRHSNYRFLHFSLHGSLNAIYTTLEELTNDEFSKLTKDKLQNRRVTFSACEVGAGTLVNTLQRFNKGVESVATPLDKIAMELALPFWLSFYTKAMFSGETSFQAAKLKELLAPLCKFFGFRLNWSYWTPLGEKWNNILVS